VGFGEYGRFVQDEADGLDHLQPLCFRIGANVGRVAHFLHGLVPLGNLRVVGEQGVDDRHSPAAPQDAMKFGECPRDVREVMRGNPASQHGEGAGGEGEVLGVGLTESNVVNAAFLADELLRALEHDHGQVGCDHAAHQRGEA